eukprot:c4168_g1_i1 orf=304-612(+)
MFKQTTVPLSIELRTQSNQHTIDLSSQGRPLPSKGVAIKCVEMRSCPLHSFETTPETKWHRMTRIPTHKPNSAKEATASRSQCNTRVCYKAAPSACSNVCTQ